VVGVCVGRVDGTPRPGHVGRDDALPLLDAVFGLLPRDAARALAKPVHPLSAPAPMALRGFDHGLWPADPAIAALALVFPPDGATLDLSRQGRFRPLPLRAEGSAGPLRWLVNGRLLDGPVWHPDGPGAASIMATDGLGRTVRSTIWIE
jgi:penicillin-binding protein 1C